MSYETDRIRIEQTIMRAKVHRAEYTRNFFRRHPFKSVGGLMLLFAVTTLLLERY